MIPLFNQEEFRIAKTHAKLKCQCEYCGDVFERTKHDIAKALNGKSNVRVMFCSIRCKGLARRQRAVLDCSHCGKSFEKQTKELSSSGNNFCSNSCAATYNNTHKTKGIRVSKFELFCQIKLVEDFPDITFLFNDKTHITSELDIYVPKIKTAFEINGLLHYGPVFGFEKFASIQKNDKLKKERCIELGIDLFVIDTSQMKRNTEAIFKSFYKEIYDILLVKLKSFA